MAMYQRASQDFEKMFGIDHPLLQRIAQHTVFTVTGLMCNMFSVFFPWQQKHYRGSVKNQ
jgi:hypothetical protein